MNRRQAGYLNIAIAIIFASAMITVSKLSSTVNNSVWMGLLIAGWFVPFLILSNWKRLPGRCDRLFFTCRNN